MEQVPIHELKRRLSQLVAQAESGTAFLITRHRRVVARLVPPDMHLHVGVRVGRGAPQPLLDGKTKGRYLDVIADDRRGGRDAR